MNRWSEQGETGQKKLNSKAAPTAVFPKTKHVASHACNPRPKRELWRRRYIMSKKKPKSRKKLGQIRLAVLVKARRGAQATFDTRRLKRALAQGGSAALDEEVEAGAVVKEEAAPPAMPAGAVVKEEAAPPAMPAGAVVKEEVPPLAMPAGAVVKVEAAPPAMPAGAVLKQEAAPPAMPAGAVVKVEAAPPLIVPGQSSGNTKRVYKAVAGTREHAEQRPRQP